MAYPQKQGKYFNQTNKIFFSESRAFNRLQLQNRASSSNNYFAGGVYFIKAETDNGLKFAKKSEAIRIQLLRH